MNKYNVVIIGAGVVGCCIARELSKTDRKIAVLEASQDICEGTSKANSAIIHGGYDAMPGTLKAKLNVRGNEMMEELSQKLDFKFKKNGSLVVCFDENDLPRLEELYDRGVINGVKGLEIIDKTKIKEIEPNISDKVVAALNVTTGAIVCPFGMTIAMAENAAKNGVEFKRGHEIVAIEKKEDIYELKVKHYNMFENKTEEIYISADIVINAAGVYADKIHNMLPIKVGHESMKIIARKGEYCLYDKQAGELVSHTIFQLPGKYGKGVLVTPTVHGNLLTGPTAEAVEDKEGVNTTREGLDCVMEKSALSVDSLPSRKQIITSFAGLRAHLETDDFYIKESEVYKGFIDVAGIESPGLSSAPAIGEYVAGLVQNIKAADYKKDFYDTRVGISNILEATDAEKMELISEDKRYANIICRCESISEGEIVAAINRNVGATTIDGVKRRTRAGMGRCQGGFCSPKVANILARELNVPIEKIRKSGMDSNILYDALSESTL